MREEIREGVEFLRQFLIKYGNDLSSMEIDLFAVRLTEMLLERYANHWYESMPLKGQAFRCLRLKRSENYIDPVLDKLLKEMKLNINQLGLPNDFTLWIDPGEVSVRFGDQPGYTYSIARLNKNKPALIVEDTGKIFDEKLTAFIRQNSCNETDTVNSLSLEQRTISPPRNKPEPASNNLLTSETSSSSYSPCSSCASSYGDESTWKLTDTKVNLMPKFTGFESSFYSETSSDRSDTPNSCITTASSSFSAFSPITIYPNSDDDFINLESKEKELESDLCKDEDSNNVLLKNEKKNQESNNNNNNGGNNDSYCGYVESFPYYYKLNRLYNALALQKMQADRLRKMGASPAFNAPAQFKPTGTKSSPGTNSKFLQTPIKPVQNTGGSKVVQGYPMSPANAALSFANHQGRGNHNNRNNQRYQQNNNQQLNNHHHHQQQHHHHHQQQQQNQQQQQQHSMFNSLYSQFDLVKSKN